MIHKFINFFQKNTLTWDKEILSFLWFSHYHYTLIFFFMSNILFINNVWWWNRNNKLLFLWIGIMCILTIISHRFLKKRNRYEKILSFFHLFLIPIIIWIILWKEVLVSHPSIARYISNVLNIESATNINYVKLVVSIVWFWVLIYPCIQIWGKLKENNSWKEPSYKGRIFIYYQIIIILLLFWFLTHTIGEISWIFILILLLSSVSFHISLLSKYKLNQLLWILLIIMSVAFWYTLFIDIFSMRDYSNIDNTQPYRIMHIILVAAIKLFSWLFFLAWNIMYSIYLMKAWNKSWTSSPNSNTSSTPPT